MPPRKIYTEEEAAERIRASKARWRARNKERLKAYRNQYYDAHKDKFKEYNTGTTPLQRDFTEVVLEWNEQLTKKLQENPPQWLEIALNNQIKLNLQLLEKYEVKEQKNEKPIKWVYVYTLDTKEFVGKFKKQIDASRYFGFSDSRVGYIMSQQDGKWLSKNLFFTYTPLDNERTEQIHELQ